MKIAIVGFGVEGHANYEYFKNKYPEAEFVIFNEKEIDNLPDEVKVATGKDCFSKIEGFDLVLRSPSVPPKSIKQQEHQWSCTREFMRECSAPIIGVTGSKGKGTTCSLIAKILEHHFADQPDRHVHLLGNIGVPAVSVLPQITENDVVVFEMSSFQLWDCTQSPAIAVMTMIEPDHLNVHDDYEDYVRAKLNIFYYQHDGNTAVYNQTDAELAELIGHIVATAQADDMPFPYRTGAHFDDENFYMGEEVICPTNVVKLPGKHNLMNACAAIAATWEITGHDKDAIAAGLGGSDKGADYHELGKTIDAGNVRAVLAIGANGNKIAEQVMAEADVPVVQSKADVMAEIVDTAYDLSNPGDVVILSPAAASFDMFKSYQDRGEQFIAAVEKL